MPFKFGRVRDATRYSRRTNWHRHRRHDHWALPVIENYASDRKADQYSFGGNTCGTATTAGRRWPTSAGRDRAHRRSHRRLRRGLLSWPERPVSADLLLANSCATCLHAPDRSRSRICQQLQRRQPGAGPDRRRRLVRRRLVQAGYDKSVKTKDDLKEARGEIEREIGGFIKSIKVGVDYTTATRR